LDEAESLNRAAYLALAGLCPLDQGEELLAKLLLADVPINPIVRQALAEALSPNGTAHSGVRLKLGHLESGSFIRQIQTRVKRLALGQEAFELIAKCGVTRTKAQDIIARNRRCAPHTVKKAIDYANEYSDWIKNHSELNMAIKSEAALQMAFHTANIKKGANSG
jgi:hypothetical protein